MPTDDLSNVLSANYKECRFILKSCDQLFREGCYLQNVGGVAVGLAGLAGAEKDVDLFQRTEEADEERGPAVRGASITVEVRCTELTVSRDDSQTANPIRT